MQTSVVLRQLLAKNLIQHVADMSEPGPRPAGSPGDRRSVTHLLDLARRWDIPAWTERCPVTCFSVRQASLRVLEPETRVMTCLPQDRSWATPAGGVTGDLAYVGLGRQEDYQGLDARGKIVLQDIWGLHMVEKLAVARAHGAAGCIWIHPQAGADLSAWGLGPEPTPPPVVTVSGEDGRWLQARCSSEPVRVHMDCAVDNQPGTSHHVILALPPGSDRNEALVLVAHRDTTHVSPGANDNASGMAVAMEVVRALRDVPLGFGLVAVMSAAEEGGGIGIRHLLQEQWCPGGMRPVGAVNLDMLGVGSQLRVVTGATETATSPYLNQLALTAADELGYHASPYQCPMGLADAGPFVARGIPATWLFKPDDPRIHTAQDLPSFVNPNDLKVAADIVAHLIMCLDIDILRREAAK